jgi:FixJ family two-component response regulator
MSGCPSDILDRQDMHKGAVEFLQKPFSTMTLVTRVREVLGQASS